MAAWCGVLVTAVLSNADVFRNSEMRHCSWLNSHGHLQDRCRPPGTKDRSNTQLSLPGQCESDARGSVYRRLYARGYARRNVEATWLGLWWRLRIQTHSLGDSLSRDVHGHEAYAEYSCDGWQSAIKYGTVSSTSHLPTSVSPFLVRPLLSHSLCIAHRYLETSPT